MDWEVLKDILTRGAMYNAIEVTLIALIGGTQLMGGEPWAPFLWLAFGAAALWTLMASTNDAEEEAHELVMYREVIYTDFLIGAFLLLTLSTMTMQYGLAYGAIFFVAAIQNLRYSALAYKWIEEEHDGNDGTSDDSDRDNLP
jgi:hypothetical protein